jgi:4'-phosphopantetheinyl transferase
MSGPRAVLERSAPGPTARIALWIVNLDRWADGGFDATTLDVGDHAQARLLRQADARHRLLARRSATRWILADALGADPSAVVIERRCVTCGATTHGRPSVGGAALEFSVSSSRSWATIALSELPVGVDIEVARSDMAPLPFALSAHEQRGLRSLAPHKRGMAFLRLWTAKEAVLKAGGGSVVDGLAGVDVSGLLGAGHTTTRDRDQPWEVRHVPIHPRSGVSALVAVADQRGAEVVVKHIDEPAA